MGAGAGAAGFAKSVDAWKEGWSKTLGQFVAGQLDETALLAGAEESDKEPATGQKCEACYFAGMMRLLKGDRPGAPTGSKGPGHQREELLRICLRPRRGSPAWTRRGINELIWF